MACFAIHSAQATTLYWDTNGTGTAGSGAATGTWGTSVFWTTDSTGANVGSPTLTATTVQADDLFFSAGTTGTTGTVTVSSTQLAHSITFDDPVALTLNGGTAINLGSATAGSGIFLTANGATTISTGIILNSAATAESFANSGTSTLTLGAITGAATSGTQAITAGNSSTGTITFGGIIGDGAGGGNVSFTLNSTSTGNTNLNAANTYTGATTITAGKLTIGAAGSLSSSSAVAVNSTVSGALTITAGGVVGGAVTVAPAVNSSTSNLINNGTITGNLTINSSATPTPVLVQGNTVISGGATLNAGSSTSSGGTIKDDGQLTIAGATTVTLGTITSTGTGSAGSAGTGAVFINNTTGSTYNFANGSSFSWLAFGNGASANLNSAGTTSLYSYGQANTTSQIAWTTNINSGTWNVGQVGQGNSGKIVSGTTNILGGSTFNLAPLSANVWAGSLAASNGGASMHGIWNIGGSSSGTLNITGGFNENSGFTGVPVGAAAVNGLQFTVGNGGTLTTTTLSNLGFQTVQATGQTTAQTTNSLTVNAGGSVATVGNFTLANGSLAQTATTTFNTLAVNGGTFSNSGGVLYIGNQALANTFLETNTVTVAGGTLNQAGGAVSLGASGAAATNYANVLNVSSGTINVGTSATPQALQLGTASNTAATVSNTVNLSGGKLVVSGLVSAFAGTGQVNKFNWTGGQLTAATINPGSTFATPTSTGGITTTTLINDAGTFAPGDIGTGGKTTINGGYTQNANGTLAIDLGSTTAATAFQSGVAFYDTIALATANQALTLGGTLNVSLINGFGSTITSANSFNIITGATSVSGSFSNVDAAGRVNLLTGGSIGISNTATTVTLSGFSTGASLIWAGGVNNNAWDVNTTANFTKAGVASVFNNGDVATFNNSGIANNTVNLNTTVSTSLVTFAHTSGTYTVVGSGGIGGTGALNVQGGGTVVLDTVNGYSGTTTISSGTLQLGDGTTGHDGTISNSLSIVNSGSLVFDPFATSGLDYSGVISGAGSVTKIGAGTQIFSGINTFSGLLSVQQGTLSIGSINNASANGVLGNSANSVSLGNTGGVTGTLLYTGATTSSSKKFTMATGGTGAFNISDSNAVLTLSGVIDGSGSLLKNGAGSLLLSAANTFTGGATLDTGTLVLGVATAGTTTITSSAVGTGTFTIGNGTNSTNLQTNVTNGTTRTLNNAINLSGDATFSTSAATGRIALNTIGGLTTPNAITLTRTNTLTASSTMTVDLIGAIGGNFGLTLTGGATWNIGSTSTPDSVANTYSGLTTISAGNVTLNKTANTDAIAGDILINGTGTLTLGTNSENIANTSAVEVSTGGTLAMNARTETVGAVTISGGTISTGTGTLNGTSYTSTGGIVSANLGGGAVSLTHSTGVLTLSGANTFTGGVTLNSGTLNINSNGVAATSGPLGNGGTFLINGGNLDNTSGSAKTLANVTPTTINADFAFTGGTGTTHDLNLGTGATTLGTAAGTSRTITANAGILTLGGIIANGTTAAKIVKAGSGTLALTGLNTFTGGVDVNNGTLLVGGTATVNGTPAITGSATGTGNVSFASGTALSSAGGATWDVPTITLAGAGSTLNLIGGNRLNVNYTTLELGDTSRAGVTTVNVNSKSLAVTGGNILASESTGLWSWETGAALGTPTIQNGTLDLETTTFSGSNYGAFFIRQTNFSNSDLIIGSNVILGANGTAALGGSSSTSPNVTVNTSGVLDLLGSGKNLKSLAGGGAIYNSMTTGNATASILTINGTTGTTNFSGVIGNGPGTGALSVTKNGSSTQILSGTNIYTGATTISAGTLQVGVLGIGSTASGSAVSVNGSTAVLAGTGTINGATTLTSGTLKPGDSAGDSVGTLNFNSLTYVGGKTEIQISGGLDTSANRDQINVTNALTLSNGSNFNISFSGFTPLSGTSYTWDILDWGSLTQGGFNAGTDGGTGGTNGNFVLPDISGVSGSTWTTSSFLTNGQISIVSNVPEPSRMILLFVGIAALFMRRRRS